jgi:hypothetical protein
MNPRVFRTIRSGIPLYGCRPAGPFRPTSYPISLKPKPNANYFFVSEPRKALQPPMNSSLHPTRPRLAGDELYASPVLQSKTNEVEVGVPDTPAVVRRAERSDENTAGIIPGNRGKDDGSWCRLPLQAGNRRSRHISPVPLTGVMAGQ